MLPLIAAKAKQAGERMLVVSADAAQLDRLDKALWEECAEQFLAHGRADAPHAARQPVLLSATCEAVNEATVIAFADGVWRPEGEGFARAFMMFGDAGRGPARTAWSSFDQREDVTREYWQLESGKWQRKL